MDLRQQFIKISEFAGHSEAYNYEGLENVYFKKLNTLEGEKIGEQARNSDLSGLTSKMLVKLICDEEGERVFKDADVGIVNKLPISITSEMLQDALRYNKIIPEAVEQAVKN